VAGRLEQNMILTLVHEICACAQNESHPSLNIIAFYQGFAVSDWTLARVIEAASRGKITVAGMRLYLIPIRVYEKAKRDSVARIKARPKKKNRKAPNQIPWPEVRKSDCIPLSSFLPKTRNQKKATKPQIYVSNPHEQRAAEELKGTHVGYPRVNAKGYESCLNCGTDLTSKRRGARYCDRKCKQQFRRSEGRV